MKIIKKEKNNNKLTFKVFRLLLIIFIFVATFVLLGTNWLTSVFGNITLEAVVFQLKVPLKGVSNENVFTFIYDVFIPMIVIGTVISSLLFIKNRVNFVVNVELFNKKFSLVLFPFNKIIKVLIVLLFISYSCYYANKNLLLVDYVSNQVNESKLIEEEYVNSKNANIIFPEEKRNLIYIFMESMESTYSNYNGNNYIEELSLLASENINFSNNDSLGGYFPTAGTNWTTGGMVSQTSGVPLKLSIDGNSYGEFATFLPGVYTLGEILNDNGYTNEVMFGSDSSFSGKKQYFKSHGNYTIFDLETAISRGKMTEEDEVWWGFEDTQVFEWSKDEILKLASSDKPFNYTILTSNTHFEDGYLSPTCEAKYDDQYSSVIACSSKQIYEFVEWIKQQEFYSNTTVVLVGDHITMDVDYFDNLDPSVDRTVYNVFINSSIGTEYSKNRLFTAMDMFPTTLASIGVSIEGNRLGIGTNLFSGEKTLMEKYGFDMYMEELYKKSNFYNNELLYKKVK